MERDIEGVKSSRTVMVEALVGRLRVVRSAGECSFDPKRENE